MQEQKLVEQKCLEYNVNNIYIFMKCSNLNRDTNCFYGGRNGCRLLIGLQIKKVYLPKKGKITEKRLWVQASVFFLIIFSEVQALYLPLYFTIFQASIFRKGRNLSQTSTGELYSFLDWGEDASLIHLLRKLQYFALINYFVFLSDTDCSILAVWLILFCINLNLNNVNVN